MLAAEKTGIVAKLTELSEQAALGSPIEIVDVELKGAGKSRLLRVYIDKPGGVTHGDCEFISERLGKLLDDADAVPQALADPELFKDSYTLEVSSPGVERKLTRPRDFERVIGQNIRLVVRDAIEGQTHFEGRLTGFAGETLQIELAPEHLVRVPLDRIKKANLKFQTVGRTAPPPPGRKSNG